MDFIWIGTISIAVALFSSGCERPSKGKELDAIEAYHICIGDLRLTIPSEEAIQFGADGRWLLSQRNSELTVDTFGWTSKHEFAVQAPDGSELVGSFFMSAAKGEGESGRQEEAAAQRAERLANSSAQQIGQFLGKPAYFTVSELILPGNDYKIRKMTMFRKITDRVDISMRLDSRKISRDRVPEFLAGLEDALTRWSSGQVLNEPNGIPSCPPLSN
ncbi:MAG: hypothetical protein ABJL57_06185 [Hyphomonas sp.]|uniref:hypothetical protein n=1 Tax=Hyphomonas sp. TaxID=87 RepID=UPI003266C3D6|eukprot:TRINITY_DN60624_c0_g1_i1.p1 TRINITY_DN60624_c0_g1~~TRINITY_DN60624_c0_g1_i1.p1  ORF type:complete len:217 (-),score=7.26 TRINITY_DN60624_c0_g1_i1:497-1147(-)